MHRPRTLGRLFSLLLLSMCGSACSMEDIVNSAGVGFTSVSVSLGEENRSGITGTGNGWYNHGDTDGVLNVTLVGVAAGEQYFGHVHQGKCTGSGRVMLTFPVAVGRVQTGGGVVAETSVSIPVSVTVPGFTVDFHTLTDGVDRQVSCGPIGTKTQ